MNHLLRRSAQVQIYRLPVSSYAAGRPLCIACIINCNATHEITRRASTLGFDRSSPPTISSSANISTHRPFNSRFVVRVPTKYREFSYRWKMRFAKFSTRKLKVSGKISETRFEFESWLDDRIDRTSIYDLLTGSTSGKRGIPRRSDDGRSVLGARAFQPRVSGILDLSGYRSKLVGERVGRSKSWKRDILRDVGYPRRT